MSLHRIAASVLIFSSAFAAEVPALLPDKLAYFEAATDKLVRFKDGVLVESDGTKTERVAFARFAFDQTEAVQVEGMDLPVEVEQTADGVIFLGVLGGEKLVLVKEARSGERTRIPTPGEWQINTPRLRLFPSTHQVAALADNTIWWHDGAWHHRKLPKPPEGTQNLGQDPVGESVYLNGTKLYSGWDNGEFGGMLASLDLSAAEGTWSVLSGKPHTKIPRQEPIHSIAFSSKEHLWVATGLSHLGGIRGGLYERSKKGDWKTLIDADLFENRGPLSFTETSDIGDLSVDPKGNLYLLASQSGIYRLTDGKLTKIISHDFGGHDSNRGDYLVGLNPKRLAITDQGTFFVSTNSFGILAFAMRDGKWAGKQIGLIPEKPADPAK